MVEECGVDGGIEGYRIMLLSEAQRQNGDPTVEKLRDRMIGALHGSDPKRGMFWREFSDGEIMSREQAEDYVKVWDVPRTMTYDEYNKKWKR